MATAKMARTVVRRRVCGPWLQLSELPQVRNNLNSSPEAVRVAGSASSLPVRVVHDQDQAAGLRKLLQLLVKGRLIMADEAARPRSAAPARAAARAPARSGSCRNRQAPISAMRACPRRSHRSAAHAEPHRRDRGRGDRLARWPNWPRESDGNGSAIRPRPAIWNAG